MPVVGASLACASQSHDSLSFDAWRCESILAGAEIDGPDEPLQEGVADETVDAHTAEALIAGRFGGSTGRRRTSPAAGSRRRP